MPEIIEGQHPGEYIVHEESSDLSRKRIVLGLGAGLVLDGTVLAIKTADKKYYPLAPAAVDGTEVARCILYRKTDASITDTDALSTFALAKVRDENLKWPSGISAGDKTTAIEQLEAHHIEVQLQY